MVDVKTAVKTGLQYLGEVIPPSQVRDVQLEEVSLSDDEKYWLVTFSYVRQEHFVDDKPENQVDAQLRNIGPFNLVRDKRYFKTIKLRREDGEFFGLTNLVA